MLVLVLVSVSVGSDRLRAEEACASMRLQLGLDPREESGRLGLDGRAAVETRAAEARSRVMASVVERMIKGVIGAETNVVVAGYSSVFTKQARL